MRSPKKYQNKHLFIAGDFDAFVKHESLSYLSKNTRNNVSDSMREEAGLSKRDNIPALAVSIHNSLQQDMNPLQELMKDRSFQFENYVNHYDPVDQSDNYDISRVVAIAQLDKSTPIHSMELDIAEQRNKAHDIAQNMLINQVKAEMLAKCSEIAMSSCLEARRNNETNISFKTVLKHYNEAVTEPLEKSIKQQNDLSVSLLAMNRVKHEILTDYSPENQTFWYNHGKRFAQTSLNPTNLQRFIHEVHDAGHEVPVSISNLHMASISSFKNSDMLGDISKVDIPVSSIEFGALYQRERVDLSSSELNMDVLREQLEISEFSIDSLPNINLKQSTISENPTKDLASLLKRESDLSGPSM
ncbi:hypothetical protein GNP82_08155 [Aliivibrio fischeri]|uniref:Uncharacterized protein n=1 Tax=Aliivibrio fischeri (strain MJ11) TaxID=388396 RepID=B5EVX4_ALIFM|nr:hypothetical protein [Aliivibrio fischeri]ACH64705.1 hypothetical protein VFMJ11_B0031 [Aliivibrio fischeri MJ11]MUK37521.1 hypothetical protein [Aliivibrio fischeri]